MTASDDIGVWFDRFWAADDGDSAEEIAATEASIGVRLPAVLRTAYSRTWLRSSGQMHLRTLDQLELDGDVLIFMDEQQASGLWGCRLTDAADDNPPALVAGDPTDPSWEEEGISTLALLKLFHLVNRPYEPPCLQVDGCPTLSGPELLRLGWDEYVFPLRVGPSSFWVKGSAVSDEVAIGARSRAELEQALQDIGADRWTSDILVR